MFRSPVSLRSGSKGQSVPLSADKRKVQRSFSDSSSPSSTMPKTDNMPPPPVTDKTIKTIDPALVERCINNYLSGEDVFSTLVTRLSEQMKTVVEEAVRNALAAVHTEVNHLKDQVSTLVEQVKRLDEVLEVRTDELEQYQRRDNLRIFGIAESRGEDTDAVVVDLCRSKLGVELSTENICRSHRVGKKPTPDAEGKMQPRPIIVRFISYRDRRRVYEVKKKLKGTGITVREDLTALRREVYKQAASLHGLQNTWTHDGRVLFIDKDGKKGMATKLADLKTTPTAAPTAASAPKVK